MLTPEGRVKQEVKKLLTDYRIWFYMPVQMGFGVGGIPDFICCWNGMFLGIECKPPGKTNATTPLQRRTLNDIREHGGRAVVVGSAAELELWLKLVTSMEAEKCQT